MQPVLHITVDTVHRTVGSEKSSRVQSTAIAERQGFPDVQTQVNCEHITETEGVHFKFLSLYSRNYPFMATRLCYIST